MKPIAGIKHKIESLINEHKEIYIEIRGRESLFAEGYCRIEDYGETNIVLASNEGTVCIKGDALRLRHLANNGIAVEGRIASVEFL